MERIRLTQRMAARNRKADSAEPETAIDLGKNRTYHKIDEYHTFEPSQNHWEPDMRHEWKEDKHDETGFGVPKMAKVYMAAKKATKLAMMLLGENADEDDGECDEHDDDGTELELTLIGAVTISSVLLVTPLEHQFAPIF